MQTCGRSSSIIDSGRVVTLNDPPARHKLSLAVSQKYDKLASMRLFSDHDPEILKLVVAKAAKTVFEVSGVKARISSYHIADNGTAATEDKGDVGFIATIREVGLTDIDRHVILVPLINSILVS